MTDLNYASPSPNSTDLEHLRILSICYYVVSGIGAFFSCLPIIHVLLGIIFVVRGPSMGSPGAPPPPAFLGWMFIVLGSFFILMGWTIAILVFMAARFLKARRHYVYCLIIAGVVCIQIPFGTVQGVFSFIVLLRPSVKQ